MADAATTPRGQATRERIVQSARALVRRDGVAGTSLSAVEVHARVGRSQLYHYFGDRDELLRAVVRGNADALVARAEILLANVEEVADLSRWLDAVAEANDAAGSLGCPVGSLVNQLDLREASNRAVLTEAFARWEAPLVAALGHLRTHGRLTERVPVADIADQVMCLVQGGLLLSQLRQDPRPLRLAMDAAAAYLADLAIEHRSTRP